MRKPISFPSSYKNRIAGSKISFSTSGSGAKPSGCLLRLAFSIVLAAALISFGPSVAQAGVMDKVKQWFELPDQVDSLREQYDATKKQLEDATRQIDETARQSRETIDQYRESIEQYREAEQRLREENKRLASQNEQLAEAVTVLQQAEKERSERARRTWTLIWTAVILVVSYFLCSRLFRLLLRSKHS